MIPSISAQILKIVINQFFRRRQTTLVTEMITFFLSIPMRRTLMRVVQSIIYLVSRTSILASEYVNDIY